MLLRLLRWVSHLRWRPTEHFAAEAEHNEHNEHNEYDEYDNVDLPPFPVEHYQFRSVWEAILAHL